MATKNDYTDRMSEILCRVLKDMLDIKVSESGRRPDISARTPFEISGIVGITGRLEGALVVSFPRDTLRRMTARLLDCRPDSVPEDDLLDCVGEIANIVAGNLLPELEQSPEDDERIAPPGIVVGKHRIVFRSGGSSTDQVFFDCDDGEFAAHIQVHESS